MLTLTMSETGDISLAQSAHLSAMCPSRFSRFLIVLRKSNEYNGVAKLVKARDFDSRMRWFKSSHRCQMHYLMGEIAKKMKRYVLIDKKTNAVIGRVKCTNIGFDGDIIVFYFGNNRVAEIDSKLIYYSEIGV